MRKTGLAILLGAAVLSGCAAEHSQSTAAQAVTDAASTDGTVTARGSFVGASDHITTGTAEVVWTDAGWVVSLGPDFSLDGAPDPVVALGNGGVWEASTKAGSLQSKTGAQAYLLPASVDVGDYLEVHVWCEQFSVPLGYAKLELL